MKKIEMPSIGMVTENDPSERLSIALKRSTRIELAAYQAFYKAASGHELTLTKAVEELVRYAIKLDKNFAGFKALSPDLLTKLGAEVDKAGPTVEA